MPRISYKKAYEEAIDNILDTRKKEDLENALWSPFYEMGAKCSKHLGRGLRIIILNAPCNGFGDLIFALKLSKYLREWYGAYVTIATTFEKGLLSLGADPKYVVGLDGGPRNQCRRFRLLKLNKKIPKQDLILVAPIQLNFDADLKDVQKILPYANTFNTFSFSEYNDHTNKHFTFHTGVGKESGVDREGILITKVRKTKGKPKGMKNPFALIYVASLTRVEKCILSFVEMIAKKYHKKYPKLDVIAPAWFDKKDINGALKNKVAKYYPTIKIVHKDKKDIVITEGGRRDNILTFRCDILPVPNKEMLSLMSKSIDDILLTGDQSITDAFSCCPTKNIFYQIAPWKEDLGKQLAKEMPNAYLKSVKTSCGTIKAIKYKGNYKKFVTKWDFRKRSKPKMDAIVLSILAMKKDKYFQKIVRIANSSKTLAAMKKKVYELIENEDDYHKPKKRVKKSSSTKRCKYGVKKDGGCKKKPGPKKKTTLKTS